MASGKTEADQFTEVMHTRVTPKVHAMVKERARKAGLSPATWVRAIIHKALGISKD